MKLTNLIKARPKIEKYLTDLTYKVKNENIRSFATRTPDSQIPTENAPSEDLARKAHLEYLEIMQKHYAEQYENLSKRFYAQVGQEGERARTSEQKSIFLHFQAERSAHFQDSQYLSLTQIIPKVDFSSVHGRNELYALTDQHQKRMRKTLKNLESLASLV